MLYLYAIKPAIDNSYDQSFIYIENQRLLIAYIIYHRSLYIVFKSLISWNNIVERIWANNKEKNSKVQIDLKIIVVIFSLYFFLMLSDNQTGIKIGIYRYLPKYVKRIMYKYMYLMYFTTFFSFPRNVNLLFTSYLWVPYKKETE